MSYSIEGIGERIAQARRAIGLTQDELATKLSITPQAISKWERGAGLPDISILPELAYVLEISVDMLFGEKADRSRSMPYTFSELPLVASANSIGCYSDKTVISADEHYVKFADGSVADYATQTVTNCGEGDVRMVDFDDSIFSGNTHQATTLDTELDYFENLDITINNCCNIEIVGEQEHKRGIFASGSPQFISQIKSSIGDSTLYLTAENNSGEQVKENNRLTIYTGLAGGNDIKYRINSYGDLFIGIPFESADITVSGEGDVFANNINALSATINGSGKVNLACAVTLNSRINGLGSIYFDCVGDSASIAISGVGDVRCGFANVLNTQINGVGDITAREVSRLLSLNVSGKGDIKCGGNVEDLLIAVSGVGKIDLTQLEARRAKIDLSGGADVTVGKISDVSTERVSKKSSLSVLGRSDN